MREEYQEDWDSKERRQNGKKRGKGASVPQARDQEAERYDHRAQKAAGKREKKKRKKAHFFRTFFLTIFVCLALMAASLYYIVGEVYGRMQYQEIESLAGTPMKEDGVVNILLIGNDSRLNGEDGRSDAMILLSVSTKTKKIYLTSLLRDMYVEIPGHKGNRLNAAYSFGGAELLMETVEKNLGITVNRYVLVNFEAFANLVEAVDGVELELSKAEIELVNGYLNEYNMLTDRPYGTDFMDADREGLVHLNGPQALAYTRNRYIGTDFGRTERQRKVLAEVIRKLPKAAVKNPQAITEGFLPNLTTNLTKWDCYRLCLLAPWMLSYDMEQSGVPQPGTYKDAMIRGMAVLEVDFDANRKYLQKILFEPEKDKETDEADR